MYAAIYVKLCKLFMENASGRQFLDDVNFLRWGSEDDSKDDRGRTQLGYLEPNERCKNFIVMFNTVARERLRRDNFGYRFHLLCAGLTAGVSTT